MQHGVSVVAQAVLWVLVVVFALIMQVIPLLLILTLFNMAIGISSTTMLIVIPFALFGSIFAACSIAERRRRAFLPSPQPPRMDKMHPHGEMRGIAARMIPHLKRNRFS
jgi:hypothetical protein